MVQKKTDSKGGAEVKILFEHDYLYYLPQFEPIINHLKRQNHLRIYASLNESVSSQEKKIFQFECDKLGVERIRGNFEPQRRRIIKEMDFDLIFTGNKSSLSAIKGKNSYCIMVYHGIGLKQSYYSDLSNDLDLICVESTIRKKELFKYGIDTVVAGFTKLDLLKQNKSLSNGEKTILYAPTYFPSSLQKTIPVLSDFKDVNVKIKLHHFYWTHARYISIRDQLEERIVPIPNIEIVPFEHYSILPLFNDADLLISDLSSTLFEFLPLNRPIIQTTYYSLRMKYKLFPFLLNKRLDESRMSQIDFTTLCHQPEDLWLKCQESLMNPDELSTERTRAQNKFLGACDGQATSRLIKALNERGIPIGEGD